MSGTYDKGDTHPGGRSAGLEAACLGWCPSSCVPMGTSCSSTKEFSCSLTGISLLFMSILPGQASLMKKACPFCRFHVATEALPGNRGRRSLRLTAGAFLVACLYMRLAFIVKQRIVEQDVDQHHDQADRGYAYERRCNSPAQGCYDAEYYSSQRD